MSLLSYLMRTKNLLNSELCPEIPRAFIRLLKAMAPEQAHHRKDLILAIRQFLSSADVRPYFKDYLDELLNMDIWLGPGITSPDLCRPLAYSTVADLVHHCRADLTQNQLSTVITWFTAAFCDPTVPTSMQVLISKLFINIIESLHQREDPNLARRYAQMMETFVDKLEALAGMRDFWPSRASRRDKGKAKDGEKSRSDTAPTKGVEGTEAIAEETAIERAKIIGGISIMQEQAPDQRKCTLR